MTVYLVGAGPGDPGLLTVRGAELLAEADVVVHDRLAERSLLDLAPAGAQRIDVGKSPGAPVAQEDINQLLVEHGRLHPVVVRLKGGDPFVFGRGGEEAEALIAAGVEFEVVPGITSAVGVPAYAGIPVTHRGLSTSFTVVTGHSRHSVDSDVDWESLARAADTVVVLMGVAHRAEIADRLMAGGLDPQTPVAAVRWGTRPDQRTVRTTLARLGETALEPPVTMVIGKVAGLDFDWLASRPLLGRRVVVTRAAHQGPDLAARLRAAGAEPVEIPTVQVVDPADGGEALAAVAARAGEFDWVVFSSANAVARLFACLRDARGLGGASVGAVGPGTAAALLARGVVADLVPDRSLAEALVEAFGSPPGSGSGSVLLPQAADARPVLAEGLRAKGWDVTVAEAYRTVAVPLSAEDRERARGADAIAFTSASTVTSWLSSVGRPQGERREDTPSTPPVVACIGPVTAAAATAGGLAVTAVADPHDLDGLVDALAATFAADPTIAG